MPCSSCFVYFNFPLEPAVCEAKVKGPSKTPGTYLYKGCPSKRTSADLGVGPQGPSARGPQYRYRCFAGLGCRVHDYLSSDYVPAIRRLGGCGAESKTLVLPIRQVRLPVCMTSGIFRVIFTFLFLLDTNYSVGPSPSITHKLAPATVMVKELAPCY